MSPKYSIWQILFFLFTIIAIVGVIFVATVSFFFYRSRVIQVMKERVVTLEVLANTIGGPSWTVANEWMWYPGTIENIIQGVLDTPGIRFVRLVDEKNKIIEKSTDENEVGIKVNNLPLFGREVKIRDGLYKEEKIKELSIKARNGSNLWMGLSFKEAKSENLYSTIIVGLVTLILFTSTLIGTFLLVRKMMIKPLLSLMNAFEKLENKDYGVNLSDSFITEVNKVFQSFNYTVKRLGQFHKDLEESKQFLEKQVEARTKELRKLTEEQEKIIQARTKELRGKMTDLERFQKFATGRELKMIELKKEITKLKK